MAQKVPFKFVQRFEEQDEWAQFRLKLFPHSVLNSNKVKCQICPIQNHLMRVQYFICANQDCEENGVKCPKRYRLNTCLRGSDFPQPCILYESGKHEGTFNSNNQRGLYFIINLKILIRLKNLGLEFGFWVWVWV